MTKYRMLAGESAVLYSPLGLRLMDEFTGGAPIGRVRAFLDRRDDLGAWRATDIQAVVTPGGVLTYPGLERRRQPTGLPARRYRVRIEAEFYRPFYRLKLDGREFDAFPFDDTNPPATVVSMPQDELLMPSSAYPFPDHVRVLRGAVIEKVTGIPVADVLVGQGGVERVLTDERGVYALPLRWVKDGVAVNVDATDQRKPRVGMRPVTLPQDLGKNIVIQI